MSYVIKLTKKELVNPPPQVVKQLQYEVIMGSFAYGVSSDMSDIDLYGFCIPQKDVIFPHLRKEIIGFDKPQKRFDQFQQHHIIDKSCNPVREYDLDIYNIVKYFRLCADNNPNMIDSLFVPIRCVTYITPIGELVRENRKLFLHCGAWHKFKGYAYSQLHKLKIKKPDPKGKRFWMYEKYGYDVKFAYHVIRLLDEVHQILTEGDIDLERNREQLKSVRRGEWKLEDIEEHFQRNEKKLQKSYDECKLPYRPEEEKIKNLLLNCLEQHFGSLSNVVPKENKTNDFIHELENLIFEYK